MGHIYAVNRQGANKTALALGYGPEAVLGYVHTVRAKGTVPLFELYSPPTGDYLYTSDWTEVTYATTKRPYINAGTIGYLHPTKIRGTAPLERFWLLDTEVVVNPIAVSGDAWSSNVLKGFVEAFDEAARIFAAYGVRLIVNPWTYIPVTEAGDYLVVSGQFDFWSLNNEWSSPYADGIDIFGVSLVPKNAAGFSPIDGSCDHGGKSSGIVLKRNVEGLARVIVHEVIHYLGLDHYDVIGNMMHVNQDDGGEHLESWQIIELKRHCMVRRL